VRRVETSFATPIISGINWTLTSNSLSTNPPDADAGITYPTWTNNAAKASWIPSFLKNIMNKKLAAICFTIFGIGLCIAQTNFQAITNWGTSRSGVQLSIALTNNLIIASSETTLSVKIKNSSSNNIALMDDLTVYLKDKSGNEYMIKSPVLFHLERIVENIKSGEIRNWSIPLTVGKDIQAGDYTLKAARKLRMNIRPNKFFQQTSFTPKNMKTIHLPKKWSRISNVVAYILFAALIGGFSYRMKANDILNITNTVTPNEIMLQHT
jgi:hypothetical protein